MSNDKRITRLLSNFPANPDLRFRAFLLVHEYHVDALGVVVTSCDVITKLKALDKLRVGLWNKLVGLVTSYDLTSEERVALFGPGGKHAAG